VVPKPAQPFDDLRAEAGGWAGRAHRPVAARHREHERGGDCERDAVDDERHFGRRREEQRAERRTDELERGDLCRVEAAVCRFELVAAHDRRHDRLGRVVEEGLARAQREGDDAQQRNTRETDGDREGQ